jgi:hypothetical protein
MPAAADLPVHRSVAADAWRVPPPFRAFAVRSEEAHRATVARAPYGRVQVVRTAFLDAGALAALVGDGRSRVRIEAALDVDYAATDWEHLAALAPGAPDLVGAIAAALQMTRVLGADIAAYRPQVAGRIDYLACRGAGFHNDVARHWPRCLFWLLALELAEVEFVMPHAGLRLALAVGELIVFDQTLAHGLCRPQDRAQAVAASFETGVDDCQLFLTGELLLSDAQWAALGAPWLPVEEHARRGALDLLVATFDERSGAIQRLHVLRDGMRRGGGHADVPEPL